MAPAAFCDTDTLFKNATACRAKPPAGKPQQQWEGGGKRKSGRTEGGRKDKRGTNPGRMLSLPHSEKIWCVTDGGEGRAILCYIFQLRKNWSDKPTWNEKKSFSYYWSQYNLQNCFVSKWNIFCTYCWPYTRLFVFFFFFYSFITLLAG